LDLAVRNNPFPVTTLRQREARNDPLSEKYEKYEKCEKSREQKQKREVKSTSRFHNAFLFTQGAVFKTGAFNRSATPPEYENKYLQALYYHVPFHVCIT